MIQLPPDTLLPALSEELDLTIAGTDVATAEAILTALGHADAAGAQDGETRPGSPMSLCGGYAGWQLEERMAAARAEAGPLGAACALLGWRAQDLYLRAAMDPRVSRANYGTPGPRSSGASVYGGGALDRADEESRPRTDPSGRPYGSWWRD